MSILNILKFPNENLRKKSKDIKNIKNNKNLIKLINNLFDTMYFNNGIGLSSVQIGININLIVIDIDKNNKNKYILINPKFIFKSNLYIEMNEGCLSIPNIYYNIKRHKNVIIKYNDINNNTLELNTNDNFLLSSCIQHEIDHLNGKLFIDYLSDIKKYILFKKKYNLK